MIGLPTYDENNWNFISRGTGSTEPVLSDDGIITVGKYMAHLNKQLLDKNKVYNVYFYIPNTNTAMYMGISQENIENRNTQTLSSDNGCITGINKATIQYRSSRWIIIFNDTVTKYLGATDDVYLLILTSNSSSVVNNKILAITEEEVNTDG